MKLPKMSPSVSLSDFLHRKLHRSCVLPDSLKGKERLISPLVTHGDAMESNEVNEDPEERVETDKFPLEFVLEQFKCPRNTKEDHFSSSASEEVRSFAVNNIRESRKRKNLPSLIIIGGDPRPPHLKSKLEERKQSVIMSKKPKHLFNHYGNGRGWWDGNMECVDIEEVGSRESWEGVGSATLGGLDWH